MECSPWGLFQAADINLGQGLGLHFQIHLGVDVRGVQRNMAQPSADGVDIDTCTQEVDGCRVPNRMGLTRFVARVGTVLVAMAAYCVTTRCIPNRVRGSFIRPRKTASLLSRSVTRPASDVAVAGHTPDLVSLPMKAH